MTLDCYYANDTLISREEGGFDMFRRKRDWEDSEPENSPVDPTAMEIAPASTRGSMSAAEWSPSGLITVASDGDMSAAWSNKKELAILKKEIRLQQKALRVQKKGIAAEMSAIRIAYRQKAANRGPSMRGGGGFGKMIRAIDQVGRANDRSSRERELAPLEYRKAEIDEAIMTLDIFLNQIELKDLERE